MISLPIPLLNGFTPTITVGDHVKAGDPIAERTSERDIVINVAEALNAPAKKVGKYLIKNPGDSILPGDTLAKKGSMLGLSNNLLESKVTGTILRFERDTGELIIRMHPDEGVPVEEKEPDTSRDKKTKKAVEDTEKKEDTEAIPVEPAQSTSVTTETLVSPIDGVVSLCNNDQIVIDTEKDVLLGIRGGGKNVTATLLLLPDAASDGEVALHHLTQDTIDTIICGGLFPRDTLMKAVGMGVKGVIATNIAEEDIEYMGSKHMTTPIIVIETDNFSTIAKKSGKKAYLDGETKSIVFLKV